MEARFYCVLLVALLCVLPQSVAEAQQSYKEVDNVSYVSDTDTSAYRRERCKLDIYYPTGTPRPFKTIVWFHGGGLTGGQKEIPTDLKGQGVAVVAPNYRLSPRAHNPQYTEDAAEAVAWVMKHINEYGGDASQVYVSGHSAGGYLTLMLALDKSYLAKHGIDADSIRGYFPIGGQTATHYTIRQERRISFTSPIVDKYSPLNNVRKLSTRLVLITGDRKLEQMGRYEENLYLKAVLEGIGNKEIPIHELSGFDHGNAAYPGRILMMDYIRKDTQRKSVINDAGKGEPVSRTLIVFYDGNVGKKPLKAALKRLDCKIIYDYRNLNGMAVEIPEKGDVNNIMKQLRKTKGVVGVHRDSILSLQDAGAV